MNPNMTYGKTNPNTLAGGFSVVRATLDFIRIFDSAGLLESSSAWTRKDREGLQKWAANFVKWLNTHSVARKELKATNNHGTYYDLLIGLMSLYSGDKATLRSSVLRYQTRMLTHIASDGSQPIEMTRSNNLFYHVLNADGMVMLARLSEQIPDVDLLFYRTEKGGSIQKALKFLVPYITAQKTWPFFPDKPEGVDFRGAYVLYERAASIYGENEYVIVSRLIPGNFADNRVNVAYPITHIPSGGDGCVISDGSNEATLQPGTVVSSVRQYLGDKGVWVTSYGSASASIYKWTSFSGFITDVNAGETWDTGTFNSIECK
jgi:hypothetical protein